MSLHRQGLFYDIVPANDVKSIVDFIRDKRMTCSVYFSYYLLKSLADAGEYSLVYDLITCKDSHSWYNMIKEGATSCFEAWGKSQKPNISLCHPWASGVITVIIEDIIGLKPVKPGWKEISFKPHIPDCLQYLDFEFLTNNGRIKFSYKNNNPELILPTGMKIIK